MRLLASGGLLLGALLIGGCPKAPVLAPPVAPVPTLPARDDLYVVLPSPDGHPGQVAVTHVGQEQVLQGPYAAARIRQPGTLETGVAPADEVQSAFGPALSALPEPPASFILYFVEGTDTLTPESQALFVRVSAEIARRPAPEVVVVGHTDRVGSVAFNDTLSLQRAERVKGELAGQGVAAERIQTAGRGEREPLVPTADEVPEPRNRRVEISVR